MRKYAYLFEKYFRSLAFGSLLLNKNSVKESG